MITWEAGKAGYEKLWSSCEVKAIDRSKASAIANTILKPVNLARYQIVADKVHAPWWMIAAIHWRESSGDFETQLWQGDPLNQVSTHVPKGKGPYTAWSPCAAEAIDAHMPRGMVITSPANAAWFCELYNGWGYTKHGVNSPYVWSWTNHQQPGKYVRDGEWSASAVDEQPGCAAIWRALEGRGVVLDETATPEERKMAQAPAPAVDHAAQLENVIAKIEQVASLLTLVTGLLPSPWNRLAGHIPHIIEDGARWIEAARNPTTSAADVSTLINLTATHLGGLVQSIKPPAAS